MQKEFYLSLGSNLNYPLANLNNALFKLNDNKNIELIDCSRLYKSKAVGPLQPFFYNVMCRVKVLVTPVALLQIVKKIEYDLGRRKSLVRWGPRVVDLDLIYSPGIKMVTKELIVPHSLCWQRLFVLKPWLDVCAHDNELFGKVSAAVLQNNRDEGGFVGWL